MKNIFSLFVFFFILVSVFAQKKQVDSLLNLLQNEKMDTGRIRKLIQIGRSLYNGRLKNDSSSIYLQQAVDLSKKINDKQLEAEATFYLAGNLNNSAHYARALILSLQNLKLLEQQKREKKLPIILSKDWDLLFYQNRLLVFIYSNIGDYKKQLEYVKRMQDIFNSRIANLPNVSVNYNFTIYFNLAHAYENLKMPDSSFHYRLLLYKEVLNKGDAQWLALSAISLGSYYQDHKNIDTAMMLFRKCIPAAAESGRLDVVGEAELHIGKLFLMKGKKDSAFYYTRNSLQGLSKLNAPKGLLEAYKQLSELYHDSKKYDSAYTYLQNFIVLKDSLQDLTKITEAQNFIFNQTLLDQQVEQAKKDAQQQLKTRIKVYTLAVIIAFILLAAFFLMRNLRNKRRANILLTQQKEEVQNSLAALKSTQSQLIQSEKMASLGELTAGIAHEIQNPLNFVNNFSEVSIELIDEMNEEISKGNLDDAKEIAGDLKQNLEKINHHGKRAGEIVKGMLQHSRTSSGQKEPTDINALCDEYLRLAYHGLRAKDKSFNATMKTDFDETIGNINIIPQDIGRVILNLITNAFFAINEKSKQNIAGYEPIVNVSTKKENNKVLIAVKDNGNGISESIKEKIFQPFFTTKPTGQGTGLGLSLSYDIVKAHGGELKVETKEGEETEFIIQLPFV